MSRDHWRSTRRSAPVAGRATLIAAAVVILVILAIIVSVLVKGGDGARKKEVADAAGTFGDCYRVNTRVDTSSVSGTLCSDGSASVVMTVDSQPVEILRLATETYVRGNDFTWAALGVASERGIAGWALYAADKNLLPAMDVTPGQIAGSVDDARVDGDSLVFDGYSVTLGGSGSLTVTTDGAKSWTMTPDSKRTRSEIDAAAVEATVSPLQIVGDGYGGLTMKLPPAAEPAPPVEEPPAEQPPVEEPPAPPAL